MEHAPLRPVPGRPRGPVSDADAVRTVSAALPALGGREGLALALVALVGRSRDEAAQRVGLGEQELGAALARARKELRRTMVALPGSGWCERAERLVSDRLDSPLSGDDVTRLDVHLRNCPRCVEHERRLVQATDMLAASVAPAPRVPELEVARGGEPETAEPEVAEAEIEAAGAEPEAAEPEPRAAEPDPQAEPAALAPAEIAPLHGPRPLRELSVTVSWHVLFALAVLLAIASVALAVTGVLGAGL